MIQGAQFCLGLVSKPADIINIEEAAHRLGITPHYIVIYESKVRCASVKEILVSLGRNYDVVVSTDVFSFLMAKINNQSNIKKITAYTISILTAGMWRMLFTWLNNRNVWRWHVGVDLVITDLWRTKVSCVLQTYAKEIIVVDGGLSTKHLGLLPVRGRSLREVVADYLESQIVVDYAERSNPLLDALFKRLRYSLYSLSKGERKLVSERFSKMSALLFSLYADSSSAGRLILSKHEEEVRCLVNDLSFFQQRILNFSHSKEVWIVGYPNLKNCSSQIKVAKRYGSQIKYFIHPRDQQILHKNRALRINYFDMEEKNNLELVKSGLPMEWYLLDHGQLPAKILTYRGTSLVAFLSKVGLRDKLAYVD